MATAKSHGVDVRLGAEVQSINFRSGQVTLSSTEVLAADVVVGADGLWSTTRDLILDRTSPPIETGDLAYRGTFSKAQLLSLGDSKVEELCSRKTVSVWLGPMKHAVFYPLKGGEEFNLILLRPDDLPKGTKQEHGEVSEMRETFEGWDPTIQKIISCLPSALKWKLCHHEELKAWSKACRPNRISKPHANLW